MAYRRASRDVSLPFVGQSDWRLRLRVGVWNEVGSLLDKGAEGHKELMKRV